MDILLKLNKEPTGTSEQVENAREVELLLAIYPAGGHVM